MRATAARAGQQDARLAGARQPTEVRPRGLRLVPPTRRPAPRAPFVVLLGGLLSAGLAGLLYLHTALAEDSFRLHDLATRSAALADQEQALQEEVARSASPAELAARAEALGMVPSENPAFIRLSDGTVLGKPKPGVAPPPPPAPEPSATASGRTSGEAADETSGDGAAGRSTEPADGEAAGAEVSPSPEEQPAEDGR